MQDHIKSYKEKLGKEICNYMDAPVTERAVNAIIPMLKLWDKLCKMGKDAPLTYEDALKWEQSMQNADGSRGAHWTMEQTTAVAESTGVKFDHITAWCWNTAMNMMYSDYYPTAVKYGVNTPDFYASLAKDFLFDPDALPPKEKMAAYRRYVVK